MFASRIAFWSVHGSEWDSPGWYGHDYAKINQRGGSGWSMSGERRASGDTVQRSQTRFRKWYRRRSIVKVNLWSTSRNHLMADVPLRGLSSMMCKLCNNTVSPRLLAVLLVADHHWATRMKAMLECDLSAKSHPAQQLGVAWSSIWRSSLATRFHVRQQQEYIDKQFLALSLNIIDYSYQYVQERKDNTHLGGTHWCESPRTVEEMTSVHVWGGKYLQVSGLLCLRDELWGKIVRTSIWKVIHFMEMY